MVLEDVVKKNATVSDGTTFWKEGHEPGSDKWIARRELLKRQDFTAGSRFRQETEPAIWKLLEDKYLGARNEWERNRPVKTSSSKASKSGTGGRKLQWHEQEHVDRANEVNTIINDGITADRIERIIGLELGPKAVVKELDDGTFQILDAQNNATIIDPNNPMQARTRLYNVAGVDTRFRDKSELKKKSTKKLNLNKEEEKKSKSGKNPIIDSIKGIRTTTFPYSGGKA